MTKEVHLTISHGGVWYVFPSSHAKEEGNTAKLQCFTDRLLALKCQVPIVSGPLSQQAGVYTTTGGR